MMRAALTLALLLFTARALGQQTHETAEARGARAFFEIGAQAYDRGDYDGALEAFHEAYARAARPGLLFSMAQAHRRAFFARSDVQHLTSAVELYRKYLDSGDQARRRDAEQALEQLVPLTSTVTREDSKEAPVVRTGKLMIASSTPDATLFVDGVRAPHLPFVVTVNPGPHTLTLTAPGYRKHERTIPVPEGTAFALDIALEPLPGVLTLTGTEGSEVLVDGRMVGALPLAPLSLEAGSHRLTVQKAGSRSSTRSFELDHGRSLHIDSQLLPSTQHKASVGLLWMGGLSVLGASVLAVAALDRQSDADERLAHIHAQAGTVDERMAYNHMVRVRNRLRGAAIGLGAIGLASMLIGVALMAFDRPPPAPLFEPVSPKTKRKSDPARRELMAGPSWDLGHIGIEARGTF
jgi:hypothetical protein